MFTGESEGSTRIVARRCDDGGYSINTWVYRKISLRKSEGHFVQWQDRNCVYGISFPSAAECVSFMRQVNRRATAVKRVAGGKIKVCLSVPGNLVSSYCAKISVFNLSLYFLR